MRIYLAAKYSRMEELRVYRDELTALGHTVTSRWLDGNHEQVDESDPTNDDLRRWAVEDLEDIDRSSMFLCFTGGDKSAGRNIELGYALRRDQFIHDFKVAICGPRESVFHHLKSVQVFETWPDAIAYFEANR